MSDPDPTILDGLSARLWALARHDRQRAVFGAAQHAYQVYELSPDDLLAARTRHGAGTLPAAWVWWVTEGPGVDAALAVHREVGNRRFEAEPTTDGWSLSWLGHWQGANAPTKAGPRHRTCCRILTLPRQSAC